MFFSSFIFAFAHTYTLSFHLLGHLVSGLLFSTLYYKTRDLRDSIFAHSVTNILVTILLFVNGLLFQ
ncbi:CPBP family glutamic-type intramembrane protease [Streptococcus ovuberis]|uniref:CPBP family glutamic-type intramembrane protease n=1 Tax=Streptococcus ovuberis TaxID=1936207 RepID=UPI003CCCF8F1